MPFDLNLNFFEGRKFKFIQLLTKLMVPPIVQTSLGRVSKKEAKSAKVLW